ncbi:tRNA epoxyqueuosine(34) reductase QueG [Algisphaera agarilytica]|uniref:Epoxyqueuosine reductase n=1 Tax=Algisphaera agarilytica TaxID=1385975 RepID=A0A7X0LMC2_9BACT|nr:tRNA epoxyqueuosine(34) reductase QueG [Algisphaera agarilytica]MBB6431491.1 epoxyqueuosine reductase [Algisphaera agarilytica]
MAILESARDLGFALAGIAPAGPSEQADAVRDWVAQGKHGTMGWIENHLDIRVDLEKLLPGAASVVAVCDAYASQPPEAPEGSAPSPFRERAGVRVSEPDADHGMGGGEYADAQHPHPPPAPPSREGSDLPRGKIARYAWGDDYHKVLKKRLHKLADTLAERFPEAAFRTAVDTAPALEREIAARAGLGWQGKNTMLIHPRHGSYTLLGLVVTTLELPSSEELGHPELPGMGVTVPATDHCANCTRCIDACPTDAIAAEGYSIDASRCVSYLTIEHREPVPGEFLEGIGEWIAGCDICQEVCPYNTVGQRNPLPVHERYDPGPRGFADGLDLVEVLSWAADDRTRVFQGSALKRIKLDMIRRNALIAIGNVLAQRDDAGLRDAVQGCLDDESELVATTARQVWDRIQPV